MVTIFKKLTLGDMDCHYLMDSESKNVELILTPADMETLAWEEKKQAVDSLIQVKRVGDAYPGGYAGGNTMRQSVTTALLQYEKQQVKEDEKQIAVHTWMRSGDGCMAEHVLV